MSAPACDFIFIGAGSAGCAAAAGLAARVFDPDPETKGWVRPRALNGAAGAQIMPRVAFANTNAPAMMIGHRAGAMIAEDASRH